jgi:hypothetical protein
MRYEVLLFWTFVISALRKTNMQRFAVDAGSKERIGMRGELELVCGSHHHRSVKPETPRDSV